MTIGYLNFDLVLMASRRCNLACRYCYIGHDQPAMLAPKLGRKAIDRALNSLEPGGTLGLQFFGGEPLLYPRFILEHAEYARTRCAEKRFGLQMQITTNGTLAEGDEWTVLSDPDIEIAVSCDGIEATHDLNRRTHDGKGSYQTVRKNILKLVETGKEISASCVIGPATLDRMTDSAASLRELGVRNAHFTLDLWTPWAPEDLERLGGQIAACADLWVERVGKFGIGWYDTLASRMSGLSSDQCSRCGFGAGQIAVAPSGHLYPCERLVGQDQPSPERLTGHVGEGEDFLGYTAPPRVLPQACRDCEILDVCMTFCRCSNYARTGETSKPDRLLCELNKMVHQELVRVLKLE